MFLCIKSAEGRGQYWLFCRRGQVTDPTGGLIVSALLSGGSSPGAEILEGAGDPVPVDSCFCVGIMRIRVEAVIIQLSDREAHFRSSLRSPLAQAVSAQNSVAHLGPSRAAAHHPT